MWVCLALLIAAAVAIEGVCEVDILDDSPLIPCSCVPMEYFSCVPVNYCTSSRELGEANCTVHSGVECSGTSSVIIPSYPCSGISGMSFAITLFLAIFAGMWGADRFYTGHMVSGILKSVTFGGLGVWWLVDIFLWLFGLLKPWGLVAFDRSM